ncbi:MAG: M23 family metallopeptidase [Prevotellaceae bacterium]|jgi:murein DD-endopeptidase MepM/ murein hydrolase activator NlpD|nr:M23 family metallopeptidase [Prevotellaceae bacterium]
MAKPKYHYNPETLRYERIDNSFRHRLGRIVLHLLTSMSAGILFFLLFVMILDSPYEKELQRENRRLKTQYNVLGKRLDVMQQILTDIEQRDNNMYRVIYQAEPIDESVRKATYSGSNRYEELLGYSSSELMTDLTQKTDRISKQLYVQSKSFDEIVTLAKQNEDKLLAIPAIQPVLNKDLKQTASGYGMRIDPIYKTPKFHAGMDFSAATGSDIFATGNGVVTLAGWKQGYGNCIIIRHGYGYETLYGHLSKIKVRNGAKVTRGEVIGEVGNTGKSTGPHLHYEVHYRNKPTDPRNYYFMDLSPEEYDQMLQISANFGQVFD